MKIALPAAALLAIGLAAPALPANAAAASDAAYEACARALVSSLAAHYGTAMHLLETRYPDTVVDLEDSTELFVEARSPGARRKFVSLASCTVNAAGEVQSLRTLKVAAR